MMNAISYQIELHNKLKEVLEYDLFDDEIDNSGDDYFTPEDRKYFEELERIHEKENKEFMQEFTKMMEGIKI